MRWAWRALVLVVVFAGVGLLTARAVVAHAAAAGRAGAEVRLAGEMAGLFAGGAAALLVGLAMVWASGRRK